MVEQIARYTKWWIAMLVIFLVSFGLCNIIFTQMVKPLNKSAGQTIPSTASTGTAIAPPRAIAAPTASGATSASALAVPVHQDTQPVTKRQGEASEPRHVDKAGTSGTRAVPVE